MPPIHVLQYDVYDCGVTFKLESGLPTKKWCYDQPSIMLRTEREQQQWRMLEAPTTAPNSCRQWIGDGHG
jgi:hypothetical protein